MILNPLVLSDIKTIIHSAREEAIRAVDTKRVLMYWHVGQRIFLEEQEEKVEIITPTKVGKLPTIIYLWFMQVSRRGAASKKAWKYN